MLAIVIPTILATLGVAFWFRASNERAALPAGFRVFRPARAAGLVDPRHDGAPGWRRRLGRLTRPRSAQADCLTVKPVKVQVVSLDWKWLFIYPEQGIASVNKLIVPVGTPISFELTSSSVMNSFFVPQLGSQIYTWPEWRRASTCRRTISEPTGAVRQVQR